MAAVAFKSFAGQNWLITPTALAVNEAKPATIEDQSWLIQFSGVGILDLQGSHANDWRREVLVFFPDVGAPLHFAIQRYHIPVPTSSIGHVTPSIVVDQIVPFAAVSAAFDKSTGSSDFGFAVDAWRPNQYFSGADVNGKHVDNVFTGIDVDLAVRNTHTVMHRVSYQISIIGRIAFFVTR